jgi:hypothetical protein
VKLKSMLILQPHVVANDAFRVGLGWCEVFTNVPIEFISNLSMSLLLHLFFRDPFHSLLHGAQLTIPFEHSSGSASQDAVSKSWFLASIPSATLPSDMAPLALLGNDFTSNDY